VKKIFLFMLVQSVLLCACTSEWTGYYYPNKNNLSRSIESPTFKSLDECRRWVNSQIYTYNPSGENYDYECGKNCKYNSDYGVNVCAETRR
jgi:hypothetical protein